MKTKAYPLDDYPKVEVVAFPRSLPIAYAVCGAKCGNRAFIVDGSTQVCEYCGRLMFRTKVASYSLRKPRRATHAARARKKKGLTSRHSATRT